MATDLKTQMLHRLIDANNWVSRADLAAGLSSSPLAQDDALSDLVIDGKAEYRNGMYRLAGSPEVRRAAQLLRKDGLGRQVVSRRVKDEFRVGVAEMRKVGAAQELSLVMYEMELPMPEPHPDRMDEHFCRLQKLTDFFVTEI
jgi:hypothetical protein